MSKKLSKQDEGVANYKAWLRENKKLERMGLYGTDYYIKRDEQLEAKVKRLETKNPRRKNSEGVLSIKNYKVLI